MHWAQGAAAVGEEEMPPPPRNPRPQTPLPLHRIPRAAAAAPATARRGRVGRLGAVVLATAAAAAALVANRAACKRVECAGRLPRHAASGDGSAGDGGGCEMATARALLDIPPTAHDLWRLVAADSCLLWAVMTPRP
ncbi:hypothetical protein BU14_0033s0039 [Porphyra umbilicalis]|uniref:Uncharacterized protein n=1 Tax=Porphyra umbilicalis TaxID=2786 RepID=A0A1X6PIP8_PORUM|nr:hypothetical protein BU14_0033s0039 [Porphyra umbilicalis]|eukprot:OSX80695.1 hypothetical protein BU14_0033s0039 [Porphyra umbilicalis]